MEGLLEKRQSLHQQLREQQKINTNLQAQIDRLHPLANLGVVSAMIAHEMNNILTPLGSYAQLAINNPDDAELAKKTIHKTAKNSARAAKILESMLAMAKGGEQEKKSLNLRELVDEAFTLIARDFSKDRISVSVNIAEDIAVYCQPICLQQVLMNLIINARCALISAGRGGGLLNVSARTEKGGVVIEVSDNGCGIPEQNLSRIFDVFYTARDKQDKTENAGSGLGLAFCKKVIDEHDGNISAQSEPDVGTVFRIILPDA